MTFASLEFILFLAAVLLALRLAGPRLRVVVALVAGFAFYAIGSIGGLILIIATSAVDYNVAKALDKSEDDRTRWRLLLLSLASNLGLLVFFKYTNFFLQSLGALYNTFGGTGTVSQYDILLPPGISYFTFSGISYVLDVYYGRLEASRKVSHYFLYIGYFPKLLAGPIARAGDFLIQLKDGLSLRAADVEVGIAWFLVGAVKKMVIADQLAPHVDLIFGSPGQFDGLTLVQGVLGYAVQIYCDFSGYSDMAVGCARMMGIRLPDNFDLPYAAASITDFWRRWHMTLSSWFRDYLFFPLEIALKRTPWPNLRSSINLVITMLLCGLWHGANWNFVLWGGIHGASLAINRAWSLGRPWSQKEKHPAARIATAALSHALTLGVVLMGWVFFRANSWPDAMTYLSGILSWSPGTRVLSPFILGGLFVVAFVHIAYNRNWQPVERVASLPAPLRAAAYGAILLLLATLGGAESAPFVYFQF